MRPVRVSCNQKPRLRGGMRRLGRVFRDWAMAAKQANEIGLFFLSLR
ncbi:hypothetical protein PYK22_02752 [Pyrinomonas methylaliphatogenes]|uniref:Uncharacterized protein n=1 Tax=Pyrinomonas methylaliphatogenes TaxID=454194 RepID=A0A0B6X2D1_9BACT|nr:hypothetical protein PYK22_02752 [Pyrinomonas methylaliphatogenes]